MDVAGDADRLGNVVAVVSEVPEFTETSLVVSIANSSVSVLG